MADQARYGGINQQPICVPSVLGPMIMCFVFPPVFVLFHELRKDDGKQNLNNVLISFILTSMFYFPGLIHGMNLIRYEGSWNNNYDGL